MATAMLVVAIWVLCVLLVPKRTLKGMRERLQQTARGDRVHVFGPPAGAGGRHLVAFIEEAIRLIEAGLPLLLVGLWAEAHGRRQRGLAESGKRLLAEPQPKAHAPTVRRYRMPPMSWRREWEASLLRKEQEAATPEPPDVALATRPSPRPPAFLKIRTLGALQLLTDDGEDLAPGLLRHPVLSFIWLYLLSHQAVNPGASLHRQLLADEVFPGIDGEQQRDRLRKRLNDFQADLPRALAERIKLGWDMVRLELEGAVFDVATLYRTVDEWGASPGLLPKEGVAAIEEQMATSNGEYLPFWDDLDYQVSRGRGTGGDLIRTIRQSVGDTGTRLLVRLAQHYRARRDSARVIPLLEEALRRGPEREDLAKALADAYRETGQTSHLRQLEARYPAALGGKRGTRDT